MASVLPTGVTAWASCMSSEATKKGQGGSTVRSESKWLEVKLRPHLCDQEVRQYKESKRRKSTGGPR